jgi:hypothetical protein
MLFQRLFILAVVLQISVILITFKTKEAVCVVLEKEISERDVTRPHNQGRRHETDRFRRFNALSFH